MNKKFWCILFILLTIWAYFIEPNMLIVKNYKITDVDLSGLKIVFLSDLHIKSNQKNRLTNIVTLVNKQNPDLVLSAGDFVNGDVPQKSMSVENIAGELKNIKSKYGFYAVLGNHDWWSDGNKITNELNKNGINILANSNIKIKVNNKYIYIAGIEDMMTRNPDIYAALKNTSNPTILITHSPDIFPSVSKNINLVLAGHTHGGQVCLPLFGALFVPSEYGNQYANGLIVENNKKMIVTKGIGTSILSIRFNCIPEIVVIDFV